MANLRTRPRLFLANFDFEHRIADPKWVPNEKLKRLNAEMAATWLSIAKDGDLIWTPLPFDEDFLLQAKRDGLPDIVPIQSLAEAPRSVECVPWGWSSEIRQLSVQSGWAANAPSAQAVHLANSRGTSEDLEQRWNVGLKGACRIRSLQEFNSAIQSLCQTSDHWVVKAEFGMSARERILGRGKPREVDTNWVRRRLKQNGVVFFEPWVDRISEVGIQIDVPPAGTPRFVGLTPMHVDRRGQYAGSWFTFGNGRFPFERPFWEQAIEVALRAAKQIQLLGYFGPLGVDAMIYRDENGLPQIRPLQDINARWTMGRLSLGWRKLAGPAEEGFWSHGVDESGILAGPMKPERRITTSPETVGTIRCSYETRILVWKTNDCSTKACNTR